MSNQVRKPIVIGGFGRSGTTWLSDIISKVLGQLLLFEPFHPCVFQESQRYCYKRLTDDDLQELLTHWSNVQNKKDRNRWLLRNHLRSPLESISSSFIDYIWEHANILGFKTIRLNHSFASLITAIQGQPLFIIRHPLAVTASIVSRSRFFEEYGFKTHWMEFITKSLIPQQFETQKLTRLQNLASECLSSHSKIVFMWGVSHMISLKELKALNCKPIFYERLYKDPFTEVRNLLDQLGLHKYSIHPSYLFTPSMLTLKTVHETAERHVSNIDFPGFFWKNIISKKQSEDLFLLLTYLGELDEDLLSLLIANEYLSNL